MLTLSGRVKETQQVIATQFSFRLRTPDLIITVPKELIKGILLVQRSKDKHKSDLVLSLTARGESCCGAEDGSGDFIHQPAATGAESGDIPRGRTGPHNGKKD